MSYLINSLRISSPLSLLKDGAITANGNYSGLRAKFITCSSTAAELKLPSQSRNEYSLHSNHEGDVTSCSDD